jgi:hypothetical protein
MIAFCGFEEYSTAETQRKTRRTRKTGERRDGGERREKQIFLLFLLCVSAVIFRSWQGKRLRSLE